MVTSDASGPHRGEGTLGCDLSLVGSAEGKISTNVKIHKITGNVYKFVERPYQDLPKKHTHTYMYRYTLNLKSCI